MSQEPIPLLRARQSLAALVRRSKILRAGSTSQSKLDRVETKIEHAKALLKQLEDQYL